MTRRKGAAQSHGKSRSGKQNTERKQRCVNSFGLVSFASLFRILKLPAKLLELAFFFYFSALFFHKKKKTNCKTNFDETKSYCDRSL